MVLFFHFEAIELSLMIYNCKPEVWNVTRAIPSPINSGGIKDFWLISDHSRDRIDWKHAKSGSLENVLRLAQRIVRYTTWSKLTEQTNRVSENQMDLYDAIQKLYAEKDSLLRAIAALEALQGAANGTVAITRSKRGRKSMNPDERQEVSLRMKKYWASRRVGTMEESRH
jgi:hypothetical protein